MGCNICTGKMEMIKLERDMVIKTIGVIFPIMLIFHAHFGCLGGAMTRTMTVITGILILIAVLAVIFQEEDEELDEDTLCEIDKLGESLKLEEGEDV